MPKFDDETFEQLAQLAAEAVLADRRGDRAGAQAKYNQAETVAKNKRKDKK